jgi:hypothetical protein
VSGRNGTVAKAGSTVGNASSSSSGQPSEHENRTYRVQKIGAAIALAAAVGAGVGIYVTHDTGSAANVITLRGQVQSWFNSAAQELTSKQAEDHLNAVGTLKKIIEVSPSDQPRAVAELAAFVRSNTPITHSTAYPEPSDCSAFGVAESVQAALAAISERDPKVPMSVYLDRTELSGADLHGLNLRGVDLAGADLHCANLNKTDFNDAIMDRADLTDTKLIGTQFAGTRFTGARVNDTSRFCSHQQPRHPDYNYVCVS